MNIYKTVDLCSGIGGIRRGFELTNRFKNVLSADNDKYACLTYEHLYNEKSYNDITDDNFKESLKKIEFDALLAGFPCQTFSAVGKQEGFKDITRGTIFFHLAEIIEQNRPKMFLLENVEGLITHKKGNTFKIILDTLINELGYKIIGVKNKNKIEQLGIENNKIVNKKYEYDRKDILLNAKNFGIPQNRPRVYLVGINIRDYDLKDIKLDEIKLPRKNNKEIYKNVYELMEDEVEDKYYLSQGYLDTLVTHREKQKNKGNGFGYVVVNQTEDKNPISNTILATGGSGKERNLLYQYKDGVAGKKVANKRSPINKDYIRNMTPTEWSRLQGFSGYAFLNKKGEDKFSFPDEVSDTQRYKQMGNSVCIPVIEEIANTVIPILDNMDLISKKEEKHVK